MLISSYSINDARAIESCGNSPNRVSVCDPITNTTICASIFSNSNAIGLGPLLNAGHLAGSCQNIISNNEHLKSYIKYIDKVWPIASRGEINFNIIKAQSTNLTFRIYDNNNEIIKEEIVERSTDNQNYHHVNIKNLKKGYYAYVTIVGDQVIDRGSFFVKN